MIYLPGSYANGFAPRDYEPEYPQLWNGCVGAWCPSLGPTGATLRDWSGRANIGTLRGSMLPSVAWKINRGWSLELNGTTNYVLLEDNESLHPVIAVSAFGWVYPTAAQTGFVFDHQVGSPYPGFNLLLLNSGGNLKVLSECAYNVNATSVIGATTVSLNEWHHVGITWDGATSRVFLDGKQDASATLAGPLTYVVAPPSIGSRFNGLESFFKGCIKDINIYGVALHPSLVRLSYEIGPGGMFTPRQRRRVRAPSRPPSGATMTGGMYVNQCGGMVA